MVHIILLTAIYFSCVNSAQIAQIEPDVKSSKLKYNFDFNGCPVLLNQCAHLQDDLALMSCSLSTCHNNKTKVSYQCQHRVWSYTAQLLDHVFLNNKLSNPCSQEPLILDCFNNPEYSTDCILKKKPTIRDRICWRMVNKIESLLFNDWQIVSNFLKYCQDDIEAYTCGRIPTDPKTLSQIETLKCIQSHEERLHPECENEITSLKEIKYNTLQLDKIVFVACNIDQKNFCPDEVPGTWLMYKCLLRHKYENSMTKKCQNQLFYDQRMMVLNYKMSKGLVKSCKEDIRRNHCRKGVVDDKDVRLAQILLCLESIARANSSALTRECSAEMVDHRKMLMDDYRLSPELMQECANDISALCKGIETGGKTLHCLMEHARPRRRKEKRISLSCQRSLEILIQEADPGEDWRVDPILRKACKPVVDAACSEVNGGNGKVISCLMEKIGSQVMSKDCETALLQIQYFISRDFKLDPQLYKACKYDAVTQCKAKLNWAGEGSQTQPDRDPLVLPCLYNYAYNPDLKGQHLQPACEQQVRRVMRQRAISVDLLPEIEDFCLDDLSNICFENTGKGEEILCLQQKINELSPKCKEMVSNFTESQSGHIELNPVINSNCQVEIKKLCAPELKAKSDDDNVIECLIMHKNHPDIKANAKCRISIEHEQLIALKSYKFTRKFKNACRSYVMRFCPLAQTKSQVVTCLSEIVRNDTITSRKNSVSKECRQQLRSQLIQQKESIDLDPELKEACKRDLVKYCPNVPHAESAALECLQTAKGELSLACRKAVFVVKKQEFEDNAIDYHLITSCNDMIDLYCHHTDTFRILDCLRAHKHESDFSEKCKYVIVNRMIEQNADYRFNTNLQNACKLDMKKYCSEISANEVPDVELEGKMMSCLKEKFRESKLSVSCENELANLLKEQALNYRLDPLLGKMCKAEIQTLCPVPTDITNSDGQVEQCLKEALINRKIVSRGCAREVVQIIEETEVDIEADPLLEHACALDLLKYCKDLEHGDGRKLKCLKIILNDDDRKLEEKCHKELSNRLEMYKYVAAINVIEDMGDVYDQISKSPSKKYFLIVIFSIAGLLFIFGLFCGRVTRRAMYVKRK